MGRLRKFVAALMGCAVALSGGVLAADATLIEAAKKEGAVTWYTTLIVNQFAAPAAAAFEKKYGIHVDYVRANSAEIMIRLQNEARAGKVMGDVFDSFGAAKLVAEGLLESFIPEPARKFPKEFYDTKGFWVASNLFVLTPGYNTSLVPAQSVPRSYIDLLDPLWRGKMAWNSNSSPVSAPGFVGVVLAEMGEENGLAYLKKLAAQRLVGIPATPRQVLDQVIAGEYPIALQIFNNHAVISRAQGAPAAWIPLSPALGVLNVFSLMKDAPHKNAGKLFIDFLTSTEGQQLFRDADYMPVDPAVPPTDPTLRPDGVTFRAHYFTPDEVDQKLPTWDKIFKELFR